MYPSNIRQKIRDDALILGTSMFSYEPHVSAAIYQTGPDWVWIDQEHAPWGTESVGIIAVQGRQAGVAPVIRVAWNDPGLIKKAYDVGRSGRDGAAGGRAGGRGAGDRLRQVPADRQPRHRAVVLIDAGDRGR